MGTPAERTSAAKELIFANFLPCRFKLLTQRALSLLALTHDGVGISEAEFSIMIVLAEQHGASSRDIHKTTNMDKAMITRALDRLDQKGLISRSGNRQDRRLVRLKLTAKGRRTFELIEQRALQWEKEFVRGLSIRELTQLNKTLGKLQENLERLAAEE